MAFTQILAEQSRQGTFQTPAIGGAVVPSTATRATVRATMSLATREDPTLSMDFHVYTSRDGGTTWLHDVGGHWVGGSGFVDKQGTMNPPISIRYEGQSLDNIRNRRIRLEVTIPVTMTVGAEAELL